jgi:hypothetical protein
MRRNKREELERLVSLARAENGTRPKRARAFGATTPGNARAAPTPMPATADAHAMISFQRPVPTPHAPSPGAFAAAPPPLSLVILSRTVEMVEAEEVLKLAMVASITSPTEDFLITFHSKAAHDRVVGDHFLKGSTFSLSMRPWCKMAHADLNRLDYHVELELRGIPTYAFHLSTAEHLLGGYCWIKRLHPITRGRACHVPSLWPRSRPQGDQDQSLSQDRGIAPDTLPHDVVGDPHPHVSYLDLGD